jgi:D-inositol-3-phosphate glycosyltransferase
MTKKVVLCGTHPEQFNGYSKVVYELAKEMASYEDIELYIFGFQNFYDNVTHKQERSLPKAKDIYDAYKNEQPKGKGFGETLIVDYVNKVDPDIIVIYNDLVVITNLIKKLVEIKDRRFKIVPYIDIVYKNEKNHMIKFINDNVDAGIMFTEYWKDCILQQGFDKPLGVLEHGFNKDTFYPIPKKVARKFYNIDEKSFVIVNLNRNQPRKRWDICLMAYVKFIKNHLDDNIKLMISTALNGGWDLVDIMHSECRKNGITFEQLKRHLIIIQNPQQVTDREINVMYNVGDIGINTCDGEGFGLCNFEQAGVGVPQIVPKVGGFLDFMQKSYSVMVTPQWSYYTDHSRDFVSGEAEVCSVDDFVEALEFYYKNKKLINKYGEKSRSVITEKYSWDKKAKQFYDIVMEFTKDVKPGVVSTATNNPSNPDVDVSVADIDALIDNHGKIDTSTNSKEINDKNSDKNSDKNIDEEEVDIDQLIETKISEKRMEEPDLKMDDEESEDDDIIVIDGGA